MSVPDREADENVVFTGEMLSEHYSFGQSFAIGVALVSI